MCANRSRQSAISDVGLHLTEKLKTVLSFTPCLPLPLTASSHLLHFTDLVAFLTLLARQLILVHWKNLHSCSYSLWIKDSLFFVNLETIKYSLCATHRGLAKIWQSLTTHVNTI